MPLEELIARCKARGLKVGVYDNPLWLHGPDDTPIPGTDVTFGDLKYEPGDKIDNPGRDDTWFNWVVASHKGAREYVDGFFKHFSEMGVDYIRIDFLSWYENGQDRSMGVVGRGYGRETYRLALQYICESADKCGVCKLWDVPTTIAHADLEKRVGDMVRIVAETGDGGW